MSSTFFKSLRSPTKTCAAPDSAGPNCYADASRKRVIPAGEPVWVDSCTKCRCHDGQDAGYWEGNRLATCSRLKNCTPEQRSILQNWFWLWQPAGILEAPSAMHSPSRITAKKNPRGIRTSHKLFYKCKRDQRQTCMDLGNIDLKTTRPNMMFHRKLQVSQLWKTKVFKRQKVTHSITDRSLSHHVPMSQVKIDSKFRAGWLI